MAQTMTYRLAAQPAVQVIKESVWRRERDEGIHETAFCIMKLADAAPLAASDVAGLKKAETLKEPHEMYESRKRREREAESK